jgi:hypothetical protein
MKIRDYKSGLICMVGMLLAACSYDSVCEPVALRPASAELQQELTRQHEKNIIRTQTDFPNALKGGPGFTRETAWQILIKNRAAVSFEYLVLGRLGLGEQRMQALVEEAGRYYDMHIIDVEHDGKHYSVEQWFDITPYFKSM